MSEYGIQKGRNVIRIHLKFSREYPVHFQELRQAIREAAPQAEETISYRMPAYKQNGILLWFAAYKNHIGFFPKASAIEQFKDRLSHYETSKGTIRFPLEKPIPYDLVKDIVN